jgi:predicted DNA-binding protein (MmcQ/YjbR family)
MHVVLPEPPVLFIELVDYCRLLPGAVAGSFLGETIFRVRGHVFAFLARRERVSITVKTQRANVKRLVSRPEIRRARWIWWRGWVTIDVRDRRSLPLAHSLIEESYQLAAARPRRRRDRG